ncbi:Fic family protein [Tolypothrix sp. LEGE 11397]|uniref:type II toxin-antitoxin system death-on-curing family toxin n=1 Tax=Tolypothrix sp. LEGE 11397 TaxID=2777971 RepID=UPI0018802DA9|nr:Fic family protein [Tolypothrix sp. LEGE 11397]MBE9082837.1 Fic family protein [Tolypothrix sp. LEGE 11397]
MTVLYLDLEEIKAVHQVLIERYGGEPGVLSRSQLESCVATPRQSVFKQELYPKVSDKAAVYLFSFATGHSFRDGNKRIATWCCLQFLDINGYRLDLKKNVVEELVIDVVKRLVILTELQDILFNNVHEK